MNTVKRVMITGATCLFMGVLVFSSTASAASDIEDFMGEGISFPSISENTRSYQSDNSIPSEEEFMGEGILFPQAEIKKEYVYDSSTPSVPDMMSEGLALSGQADQKIRKQPTLDVAVQ